MNGVDALPGQEKNSRRIFNRPFGKPGVLSELMSQDCYRLNMQLGSSSDVENNLERRLGTPIVGSTLLKSHNRLNRDLIINNSVHKPTGLRTFGLQSKISSTITPWNLEDNLKLNHGTDNLHPRNNMSSVSKTLGLVSEDLTSLSLQNNERLNQELRREINVNSSIMPRSLGLQTRNIPSSSHLLSQDDFTVKQDIMNYGRSNIKISAMSGTSGLNSGNLSSLNFHDNRNFNQNLKRNSSYILGLSSKNLTLHSGVFTEGNLRLNQYSNQRNNNISAVSKVLGPAVRNTTLTTRFQEHDSMKYNDDIIDDDGFRRPIMPRVIRGRNSTLSSRLFQNQNTRHCQDLSNINGFNVSHISRRDMDTLSESRSALNMRSNCMDNQSIGESVLSVSSLKSQFLNVLENLHHSILNIGPHVTAEAVRMEFDRAKQRLDNISEMSFPPSVNEVGPMSVINQSSKYIGPPMTDSTISNIINEGSLHLKSSRDLLKMIMQGKKNFKNNFSVSTHVEEREQGKGPVITSSQSKEFKDEQNSDSSFKKSVPYIRRKKISQKLKIQTPEIVKSITSKTTNKVINLKQWYPIAIGSNLILCGIDEEGENIKTDPVKKRLNGRKVELINGLNCNLIGSPSAMVSFLPKKIMALLRNGLTDRWRVLQKELLNCQTAEKETKSRKSKSPKVYCSSKENTGKTFKGNAKKGKLKNPKVKCSPKKNVGKTLEGSTKKEKSESPKVKYSSTKKSGKTFGGKAKKGKLETSRVVCTPKKRGKEIHTRSGRTVKPPSMFWLLPGNGESLAQNCSKTTPVDIKKRTEKSSEETSVKKSKKITTSNKSPKNENEETPNKNIKASNCVIDRKCKKESEESSRRKAESPGSASPRVKKIDNKSSKKLKQKELKLRSFRNEKKRENEEVKVHSSTDDGKQQIKTRQPQGKRKRKVTPDSDSNQAKKSKLEKKAEVEVESTINTPEPTKKKKNKKKFTFRIHSSKPKEIKSPSVKKRKETAEKKTVSKNVTENNEMKEVTEFEEDFELQLNDIEIPEIANVSGNPKLSRSQLRLISMETPPLKYFNNNLKLLRSATPARSPDWCVSQRTESEVKQFQKRREEAFKKKVTVDFKKTVITEKNKNVQSRDVKKMMEWVAEKTVRSPQWNSKLLQYVIPSRRRLEQQDNEEEDEDAEIGL